MNYVKFFILTCLMSILPSLSFAAISSNFSNNNIKHFYMGIQYKPSVPYFSKFSIKGALGKEIKGLASLKQELHDVTLTTLQEHSNFTLPYNPTYKKDLLGAGSIVGYSIDNFRVEFEFFYEKFNVNIPAGYTNDNVYKYFALATEIQDNKPAAKKYYTMKNTGITLLPTLVNVCYDFIAKNIISGVFPYLCIGAGSSIIDFLDKTSIKFSYQTKVGLNYLVFPNLMFFIDMSFHGHLSNLFSDLLVDYPIVDLRFTTVSAKLNINSCAGSFGIKLIL